MSVSPTPHERAWWEGQLAARPQDEGPEATIVSPVRKSDAGSKPLLCIADDGQRYWVKFANNPQSSQTLVPEVIVPELAALIDAPVLTPVRLAAHPGLVGETYDPSGLYKIPSGLAHGSPLVEDVIAREDELAHVRRDHNRQRIPALLVLWDWAMGQDSQWLYDELENGSIWSFDHGMWLDAGEGAWTEKGLQNVSTGQWSFNETIPGGLDAATFIEVADRLDDVDASDILSAVSRVPRQWAPDDAVLEALGWCLYTRKPGAAARARQMSAQFTKGGRR